jgi:hypothetical protein
MKGTMIAAIDVRDVYLQPADNSMGPKIGYGGEDDSCIILAHRLPNTLCGPQNPRVSVLNKRLGAKTYACGTIASGSDFAKFISTLWAKC